MTGTGLIYLCSTVRVCTIKIIDPKEVIQGRKKAVTLTTLSHTQANYYPVSFRLQSLLNVKHCVEESSFKPVFFYLCKSIFTFLKYANIKTFMQPSVENASIIHIIEHIFATQDFILNFIFYLILKIIFPSSHCKCGIILLSVLIKCSF